MLTTIRPRGGRLLPCVLLVFSGWRQRALLVLCKNFECVDQGANSGLAMRGSPQTLARIDSVVIVTAAARDFDVPGLAQIGDD